MRIVDRDRSSAAERETPVRFRFDPEHEELRRAVRRFFADLAGEAATRASILPLREEIADLETRIAELEASAESLPHRRKYLLLSAGFLRGVLELHRELIDEVERELRPAGEAASGP